MITRLIDALEDKEPSIRMSAASALGYIGPEAKMALFPLTKALKDKEAHVRERAAEALQKIDQEKEVVRLTVIQVNALFFYDAVPDATSFGSYMESLLKEMDAFWAKAGRPKAKGLLVAVGVKPGKKSRVWCDAVDGEIPAEMLARFEKKLGEVPAIAQQRPLAFAFEINLWGAKPEKFPEKPKAWVEAAKKSKKPLNVPDELFKVVWPGER